MHEIHSEKGGPQASTTRVLRLWRRESPRRKAIAALTRDQLCWHCGFVGCGDLDQVPVRLKCFVAGNRDVSYTLRLAVHKTNRSWWGN